MNAVHPLRIMYVWDGDYPWDVRTEKICSWLTSEGHDVRIVARNRGRAATTERLREGTVHRMPEWRYLNDASSFPAFFNPRWVAHLRHVAQRAAPDLIIARDLPLCPTAVWAGRRFDVPVMLDMAENYPAMIEDLWLAGTRGPLDILVRNPGIVRAVEQRWVPRVDHVITVVEESADRVRRLYDLPSEHVSVVSNTPPRSRAGGEPRSGSGSSRTSIVYLGLMEIPRGVGDLLAAQALLKESGRNNVLRLIGAGRDLPRLRQLAQELGLTAADVEFAGRLPHAEALAAVSAADIGVVPHHANESWNTTIPNKLFDYMAAGLPVVSSDTIPCRRVLDQTEAGLVYPSGNARALARAIDALRSASTRARMGLKGKIAVRQTYNWETDTDRLRSAIAHTLSARRSPSQGSRASRMSRSA